MKEQCRILVVGLLAVLVFAGAVQAEERSRAGELRGTFVRLTEQRVGERSYMRVVIKPLERAIYSRELALEGRRDEEAARIREGAPSRGAQIELLMMAEKILKELGQTERAVAVGRLAEEMKGRRAREQR